MLYFEKYVLKIVELENLNYWWNEKSCFFLNFSKIVILFFMLILKFQ